MRKKNTGAANGAGEVVLTVEQLAIQAKPITEVRANVSFDLTADELEQLVNYCADGGAFRLGILLAERKQRLLANARRMQKDAIALAGPSA